MATAINASWVATLGWLTWRVYHRGGSTFTAGSAPILPPDAYFFTVRAAGSQVGVSSITVDTLTDGVQITERIGLDLPIHPTNQRTQYTSQYIIGPDLRLREFQITTPGPTGPVIQHGTVEGDSIVAFTPGTGEPSWRFSVRGQSLVPPLAASVSLARQQKLHRGERIDVPVFDPVTLDGGTISMAVLDDSIFLVPDSADFDSLGGAWIPAHSDTLAAWLLSWSNGRETALMWVDSRGLPIQLLTAPGLTLDRSAFEITTINYRRRRAATGSLGSRPAAIVPRTAVAASVAPAPGVTSMQVRLSTERGPWSLPADSAGRQRMEGEVAIISATPLPELNQPEPDSLLAPWLADRPRLGVEDPAIVGLGRRILGDERDPGRTAARLVAWVADSVRRAPAPLVPRAATVLRERQADVDGHTLLFVALARASGLPARPVSGILLAGERFYLHSWAEVFIGGWVPVDPTWGEFPASANRIRLGIGTLARPLDLLPLVAGLDAVLVSLTQRP